MPKIPLRPHRSGNCPLEIELRHHLADQEVVGGDDFRTSRALVLTLFLRAEVVTFAVLVLV